MPFWIIKKVLLDFWTSIAPLVSLRPTLKLAHQRSIVVSWNVMFSSHSFTLSTITQTHGMIMNRLSGNFKNLMLLFTHHSWGYSLIKYKYKNRAISHFPILPQIFDLKLIKKLGYILAFNQNARCRKKETLTSHTSKLERSFVSFHYQNGQCCCQVNL